MRVRNYEKKEKKRVASMSPEELESVGIHVLDGAYIDDAGNPIPAGREILVTTPGSSYSGMATVGRYLYTGNVPRFEREQLELYVSKTALTLRVKAWVDSYLLAHYRYQQLYHWKAIYDAFQDPILSFVPMKDPAKVREATRESSTRAWLDIAIQYMHHAFDGFGLSLYDSPADDSAAYKEKILTGMLREILADPSANIAYGLRLFDSLATPEARAADAAASSALFEKNLGTNFTRDASRPGYEGYLTFVYPIAGSTKGPFDQPGEQVVRFGSGGTWMEARAWSDMWKDEFGGMPFMEVVSGVGFHGPITTKAGPDTWYLRRGYVSHGCFRMDASDVLELRALLPAKASTMLRKGIPLWIMSYPDVTDWDGDGKVEAMDVAYYEIPTSATASSAKKYMLPAAQTAYWKSHFSVLNGNLTDPATRSKLSFDPANGVFRTIPRYGVVGSRLKRVGFYDEVPIHVFPNRSTNVVQYRDSTVTYRDGSYEDVRGKYPPGKLNNLVWVPDPAESRTPPAPAPTTPLN